MKRLLVSALVLINVSFQGAYAADATLTSVVEAVRNFVGYIKDNVDPEATKLEPADATEIEKLAKAVETEARNLLNTKESDEDKNLGLMYAMNIYRVGARFDEAKYIPLFKGVVAEAKKVLPRGKAAEHGEYILFATSARNMTKADFLKRVEELSTEYPDSETIPDLASQYTQLVLASEGTDAAKKFTEDALKLYPKSKALAGIQSLLGNLGKPVSLAGQNFDGKDVDLKDYKGKVVLLSFWASWCGPCKALTPLLKKLVEDNKDKGVEMIGYSLDDDEDAATTYLKDHKYDWAQIYEKDEAKRNRFANKFGVRTIPQVFIIDRDGNLVSLGTSAFELIEKTVQRLAK